MSEFTTHCQSCYSFENVFSIQRIECWIYEGKAIHTYKWFALSKKSERNSTNSIYPLLILFLIPQLLYAWNCFEWRDIIQELQQQQKSTLFHDNYTLCCAFYGCISTFKSSAENKKEYYLYISSKIIKLANITDSFCRIVVVALDVDG